MKLGEKIRLQRKALKLTQTELGERLGVKTNAVSKWECGRVEEIPTSKIKAMAALFNVPPSYLIDDDQIDYTIPTNIRPMLQTYKAPRLGAIACGEPILAAGNIEGYDEVPEYIHCDFTLVCKGDSMINARIFDGDVVCIRQQPEVENGEIAAVLIDGEFDGEATLKRVKLFDDHIALEPENPQYRPMVFWGEDMARVHILGKATALLSAPSSDWHAPCYVRVRGIIYLIIRDSISRKRDIEPPGESIVILLS